MPATETDQEEEKKSSLVVDYLQGPRKKRKNFIVSIFGKNFDHNISSGILLWIKKNYPSYAITNPKNIRELERIFSRQIILLIADDQFCDRNYLLDEILKLKTKKHNNGTPVLFLTDDVKSLIDSYHKILLPYQEIDNYVAYRSMSMNQICSRINASIKLKSYRKSRRFFVDINVRYFYLSKNKYLNGNIVEMSVHGAVICSTEDLIFKTNDQLKIHLPVKGYLSAENGDFIRVSAKVRRVMMGGNTAAISWEHLSESQTLILTTFVLEYINQKLMRV